jgi:hypothetical protein
VPGLDRSGTEPRDGAGRAPVSATAGRGVPRSEDHGRAMAAGARARCSSLSPACRLQHLSVDEGGRAGGQEAWTWSASRGRRARPAPSATSSTTSPGSAAGSRRHPTLSDRSSTDFYSSCVSPGPALSPRPTAARRPAEHAEAEQTSAGSQAADREDGEASEGKQAAHLRTPADVWRSPSSVVRWRRVNNDGLCRSGHFPPVEPWPAAWLSG